MEVGHLESSTVAATWIFLLFTLNSTYYIFVK